MAGHKSSSFLCSTVGQKALVGISGVGLFFFVIAHMLGNLQFFLGPEALNSYAAFLKGNPEILWPARIGLLVLVLLHIYFTIALKRRSLAARPVSYSFQSTVQASKASRTMLITGTILLCYIIYHLAHFTLGLTDPAHFHQLDSLGRHDVYGMVVAAFQSVPLSLFYVVAMLILTFHLSHGVESFFQTLGVTSAKHSPTIRATALTISIVIFFGYVSIPLFVLFR